MKLTILFLLMIFSLPSFSQSLTKVWNTSEGIKTPESVLFDENSNHIFVSNIDGDPSKKDGNGFISLLDQNGKQIKAEWVTGLNAPKGQAIYKGNLYVADIDELVEINIKDAKITNRYKIQNAKFLNDVTVSEDGTVYVSDSSDDKIYALENGKISLWLENKILVSPNGLWAEKGNLYIGTQNILQVDMKTKKISTVVEDCGGIDGLEKMKDGNFIYSNWQGRIFITQGKKSIKLLDTADKKLNTADIDYVPSRSLVLVPTFFGNSIEAYQLNK